MRLSLIKIEEERFHLYLLLVMKLIDSNKTNLHINVSFKMIEWVWLFQSIYREARYARTKSARLHHFVKDKGKRECKYNIALFEAVDQPSNNLALDNFDPSSLFEDPQSYLEKDDSMKRSF